MIVCLASAVAGPALASFELMYLPDATTGKITRWDPISKISLGTFGFPDSPSPFSGVTAGEAPGGYAYASNLSGTRVFDPNTDTLIQTSSFFNVALRSSASGGRLYWTSGTTAWSIDPTNFNYSTRATNLSGTFGAIPVSDTASWYAGFNTAGAMSFQRVDNSLTVGGVFTTVASSSLSSSSSLHGTGLRLVTGAGQHRLVQPYLNSSSFHMLLYANLDATDTNFLFTSTFALTGFSATAALSAIAAHDGFWIVGDDATVSGTTRFQRFDGGNNLVANYTTSLVNVPTSRWIGANVIAPEPGSWASLGLGLAFIGRRRRARKD